ncbi:MAG: FAD-dependent oxidoreductase [Chloroflexota bacterium]|nr:FAD-dependent oxidoreductase [Chloroflexota bacterium]
MDGTRLIIIGGSAAGPKTAAKARRTNPDAHITILQKDMDLSIACCGYPYYIEGCFDDRNKLICTPAGVVRDSEFFSNVKDIDARTQVEVTAINRSKRTVNCKDLKSDATYELEYDKLVICTGSTARKPPIPGIELEGVTTLHSMKDSDYLRRIRDGGKVRKSVIVGGGAIGVETAEALCLSGMTVTIIELLPQILPFLDEELAKVVENYLRTQSINIITQNGVKEFLGEGGKLTGVSLQSGEVIDCQLAVLAIGVQPNSKLAADAGLSVGKLGGIVVDDYMQTSDPNIYAAGDCIEVKNIITGNPVLAPLGDLANLEGRVAGENVINGNNVVFPGTIQTGICKIVDYAAGSTGLSERVARSQGYTNIQTVISASPDKPEFMGAKLLISKMVVDRSTGKLLGYQSIGLGDVSRQIATAAMAIKGGLTVDDITNADLPYAPPFSLAIDHFIACAHVMQNKLQGRLLGVSCAEVQAKLQCPDKPFLMDTRGPNEYEDVRLGVGEVLIPLGLLRKRLHELPQDKEAEIICFCKVSLRGYEAALILMANGWRNVKVMEGGIAAWPYAREK